MATGRVNVGGSGGGLNVYCQPTEPNKKNGIWLKYDAKIKSIIQKNDLWTAGSWNDNIHNPLSNPPSTGGPSNYMLPPILNGKMYLFGSHSSSASNVAWVYDLKTNLWSELPKIPLAGYNTRAHIYNGKIYITATYYIAGRYSLLLYMFDPKTLTYIEMTSGGIYSAVGVPFIYDKYLYVLGGGDPGNPGAYMRNLYRYDLSLGASATWENAKTTTHDHNIASTTVICAGGYAYYLGQYVYGGGPANFKVVRQNMNDLTKTEEDRPDIPLSGAGARGITLPNGHFLHFSTASNKLVYEYDLPNGTSKLVNIDPPFASPFPIYDMDTNTITILSLDTINVTYRNRRYYYDSIVLPEGTFAIMRSGDFGGNYITELISSGLKVDGTYVLFKTGFDDAFIFANGQLQPGVESYYGDGTKWIRYK